MFDDQRGRDAVRGHRKEVKVLSAGHLYTRGSSTMQDGAMDFELSERAVAPPLPPRPLVNDSDDNLNDVRSRRNIYTTAWICALQFESQAAIDLLDERHDQLPQPFEDDNVYTYGRIGGHNVVVACTRNDQYGSATATTVAIRMLRSFNIQIALVVGIGGGVPQNGIKLGDVVISLPKDQFGGVLQYDFESSMEHGMLVRTGLLGGPPEALRTALKTPGSEIEQARTFPGDHPSQLLDTLFKAEDVHLGNDNCKDCVSKYVPERHIALSAESAWKVHYGTIASSKGALTNALKRDRLVRASGEKILCFEMEAAGLMIDFPCLVIKGICDYSDSHHNTMWQKRAALTAAAEAKAILCRIPAESIDSNVPKPRSLVGDYDPEDNEPTTLVYDPLDPEADDTRMLRILPPQRNDAESTIRCTLANFNLVGGTKYHALSYCWGDPNDTVDIFVNNTRIPVTTNLYDALRRLRLSGIDLVWVDAICINQKDANERNLQVKNMTQIYSKATTTYAWLGRPANDSAFVINTIDLLRQSPDHQMVKSKVEHIHPSTRISDANAENLTVMKPGSEFAGQHIGSEDTGCRRCLVDRLFEGLLYLYQRPYWRRRWILQEVALATNVRILCGDAEMLLDDLTVVIASSIMVSPYWQQKHHEAFVHMRRVLSYRQRYQRNIVPSLCVVVAETKELLSTNPLDQVFALLGICKDSNILVPYPNYRETLESVVIGMTRNLVMEHSDLDIIFLAASQETLSSKLPSWAVDWLHIDIPTDSLHFKKKDSSWQLHLSEAWELANAHQLRAHAIDCGEIEQISSKDPQEDSNKTAQGAKSTSLQTSNNSLSNYYKTDRDAVVALYLSIGNIDLFADADAKVCPYGSGFVCQTPKALQHRLTVYNGSRLVLGHGKFLKSTFKHNWTLEPSATGALQEWAASNMDFQVQGKSLDEWNHRFDLWLSLFGPNAIIAILMYLLVPYVAVIVILEVFVKSTGGRAGIIIGAALILGISGRVLRKCLTTAKGVHKYLCDRYTRAFSDSKVVSRKLFTTSKGIIGTAHGDFQIGDKVFWLAGCTKPAILRPVGDGTLPQYMLVGQAFIYPISEFDDTFVGFRQDINDETRRQWRTRRMEDGTFERIVLI